MVAKKIIAIVAFIELSIGLFTIAALITYQLLFLSAKPLSVFIFVFIAAAVSIIIGLGLLRHDERSRALFVFFSGYIILTKIMILSGLLQFRGEIITQVPGGLKNAVSVLYHTFIVIFFTRQTVKGYFIKK